MSFKQMLFWAALLFIIFLGTMTGPTDLEDYPAAETSPYKLPWKSGTVSLVTQGNRSFATHRGFYEYSWDFWMNIGTPVLAARGGVVVDVIDDLDGIGFFKGNQIVIEHSDGTRGIYGHIQKDSSKVTLRQQVHQGEHIANAGMVGATINPHLHFHVLSKNSDGSVPITFSEVDGGIPLAFRLYESKNQPFVKKKSR